jgi:diaminopimelate epimerase
MRYAKYHGLGNDYIVLNASDFAESLDAGRIKRICDRNFGVGSDGIVLLERRLDGDQFVVRVFNPDGSEAENSGNGMRIMSRYLYDHGYVKDQPFTLLVKGTRSVGAQVIDPCSLIRVDMGGATFNSLEIPMRGTEREVVGGLLKLDGLELNVTCVSVGNPHCVVVGRGAKRQDALELGPLIERHELFPQRTNVQFVEVIDRGTIEIEIWERGAGYTMASGSSACAAASACHRLGLVDRQVTVRMVGGELKIELDERYQVRLSGPVTRVAQGVIDPEAFEWMS